MPKVLVCTVGGQPHPILNAIEQNSGLDRIYFFCSTGTGQGASDPAVGFFHGIRYGRQSLSLDVVEPFRQPVIDRLTLRLFNRGQFTPEDFEGGERGCGSLWRRSGGTRASTRSR